MSEVSIREFIFPDDYLVCASLWKNSAPGVVFAQSDAPDEIQKKLNYAPELFLVAEFQDQVVGTVIGGYDGRRGMLYHLAVTKEMQGKGIGRSLLAEVEKRLRARGCRKCYLMLTPDNLSKLDFYRKSGWDLMDVTVLGNEFK